MSQVASPSPRRFASLLTPLLFIPALAVGQTGIPSDDNSFRDDHVRVLATLIDVEEFPKVGSSKFCAPAGSRMVVSSEDDNSLYVRFLDTNALDGAKDGCPKVGYALVNTYSTYVVAKNTFLRTDYRRSGVTFGGLVVPFKFRLGKSKELVSSSTIAPFVGFRTAWLTYGLTFTPVVAAGLSLVPITDATSGTTETKSAYTFAAGFRVTSSKNDKFNAGLVFGHDFVNKADRRDGDTVGKPWMSFYLGYSM